MVVLAACASLALLVPVSPADAQTDRKHVGVVLAPTCQPGLTCPALHELDALYPGAQARHIPQYDTVFENLMAKYRIISGALACMQAGVCEGFVMPVHGNVTVWYDPAARLYGSMDAWVTVVPTAHPFYRTNAADHLVLNASVPYVQLESLYLRTDGQRILHGNGTITGVGNGTDSSNSTNTTAGQCREIWYTFPDLSDVGPHYGALLRYAATACTDSALRAFLDTRPTIQLTRTPYDFDDSPAYAELEYWEAAAAAARTCQLEACRK